MFVPHPLLNDFDRLGYAELRGIFDVAEMQSLAARLSAALEHRDDPSVLRSRGRVYGSRNLLQVFPAVASLLSRTLLRQFLMDVLGSGAGIVRVLYFDKPPDRSWSLPWHKDRTIAVKCNRLASEHFRGPTHKAGVPHVEAPEWLLQRMLALRVHLDPMTAENGPLSVIPGSHHERHPKLEARHRPVELTAQAGDVLAMRPLLSHSSSESSPATVLHRRVVHFELANCPELPDGYAWHSFAPLA